MQIKEDDAPGVFFFWALDFHKEMEYIAYTLSLEGCICSEAREKEIKTIEHICWHVTTCVVHSSGRTLQQKCRDATLTKITRRRRRRRKALAARGSR